MSRSLQASTDGIVKARQALKRKNLTQKAIATELAIAAWATVNKFFTGKPVDRGIFLDICEALDLDWQEIALFEELESADTNSQPIAQSIITEAIASHEDLFATIRRHADRTRTALDPYILPLVRRESILEKCLKQIRIGVIEGKRRVIPILGAAGFGKSTILGTIYDELQQELTELNTGWIALARCDDFIESADTFAWEWGEKVSGDRTSIIEIAKQLTQVRGKGVLLLDTLDIILTKPLVPVLRQLFSQLLELGTTIAFTCRDADYSDFFEPYHESFAGFRECVQDGCKITLFEEAEVKQAARKFVELRLGYVTPESQNSFADKIIALSADSVSLQEIVRNPLLLALLCDLFAESENVPEDLTVSQLYEKYWDWKITTVRQNWQSQHLGMTKERLCLKVAATLYQNSQERLRDFAYENNLELNETEYSAYTSLKSDGILKDLGGKRIGFFHQTFLEYAIARWLNSTETGEIAKFHLTNRIVNQHQINSRYYIWPIFRQLLTLVHLSEFIQIAQELDNTVLLPFRSVAFAAISRTEPEAASILLSLLTIAIAKEYAFQETLLSAANSAPKRHGEIVWQVVVKLLEKVGKELINKAAEIAAELLARLDNSTSARFEQASVAIANRLGAIEHTNEEQYHIWGKFLSHYYQQLLRTGGKSPDLEILQSLRKRYFLFGGNVRAIAIELHLTPGVSSTVQRDLLFTLVSQPPSEAFKEKSAASELFYRLLPDLIIAGNTCFGDCLLSALRAAISPRWMEVSSTAVGRIAVNKPDIIETILQSLFTEFATQTSSEFNRSNFIALTAAIQAGGGNLVASKLAEIAVEAIPSSRISTLSLLFRELNESASINIDPELQVELVRWVSPIVKQYPIELIRGIDCLAEKSPPVQELLGELLARLLPEIPPPTAPQILKKINYIPPQIIPYLQQNSSAKESRAALLKVYHKQAEEDSTSALSEIIKFVLDESRDVALSAASVILNLAEQKKAIDLESLLPILTASPYVGVRQNILKAAIELVNHRQIAYSQIFSIFKALVNETAPEVVHLTYKLAETSIWNHPSGKLAMNAEIAQMVFQLTDKVVASPDRNLIAMTAKSAFIALNQMTLVEDITLIPDIITATRQLLRIVDISRKVDKLVITGLLSKLAKFDPHLLTKIVEEDLLEWGKMPVANQSAIIVAIVHEEGKNSLLLDELLSSDRIREEIKSLIIRERGS